METKALDTTENIKEVSPTTLEKVDVEKITPIVPTIPIAPNIDGEVIVSAAATPKRETPSLNSLLRKPSADGSTSSSNQPSQDGRGNFGRSTRPGDRNDRRNDRSGGSQAAAGQRRGTRPGQSGTRRREEAQESEFESQVIQVKRVSKTVSGGKIMRFSALVVVGDRKNRVGYGLAKGLDYQDAVAKATRKAKDSVIKIDINDDFSLKFPINYKYKSSQIYLKPAQSGTGLIAGGFLRPILQLAGIQNIYSKIVGSTNKVVGVRSAYELLNESYKIA